MKKTYREIQDEVIAKYNIVINNESKCWGRTHAHVKERMVCKWKQAGSFESTFTLLHEIGHVMTTKSTMKRAEEEYYATVWAINRCKEYGLTVPERTLHVYQRYILQEVARGKRRGGTGYDIENLNLYWWVGSDKTIEEFKQEIEPAWARVINPWI